MCMLFIKPKNLVLPANYHESLWDKNSDGLSVWNKSNKTLFKTLCKNEAYQYLIENAQSELIVHYRFGTSGKSTIEQLHGFDVVEGKYSLFHNGVLSSFIGDKEKSDTQNMIKYFNNQNFDLYEIIKYLEKYESNSRFLIVDKSTNEIHKPNCAKWNDVTLIDGYEVRFSNSYAIDYNLLGFDDWYFDSYSDDFLDNPDFMELDYLINSADEKELLSFIQCNPEVVAEYLKELNRAF